MHISTLFLISATLANNALAGYILEDDYMSAGFFDQFSFWDGEDPTHGFVKYQDKSSAESLGLISSGEGNIRMSVDSTNEAPDGRPSVRITSNKVYNYGLIVADIEHMPGGICGTWPAFWTLGPDWPNGGEIDIFEGVNDQGANLGTLHTGPGCSISDNGGFSGNLTHSTCASSGDENTGCQIASDDSNSYGAGFNNNGGGVYATEWTSSCINMWFFPRGSVPSDVLGNSPDPSTWGPPSAKFEGECDMSKSFVDQQIVFDTTFCGDWAGKTWSTSSCSQKADTCDAYVQSNPEAFAEAYWSINALKVYKEGVGATPTATTGYATSTSIEYVTQPISLSLSLSLSIPLSLPLPVQTTLSLSTTKSEGYAPIVGPSGGVYANPTGSPVQSPSNNAGYAPVVGTDGIVGFQENAAAPTPAPAPTQDSGDWSSSENGALVFHGKEKRHARHLGRHKRHGSGGRV